MGLFDFKLGNTSIDKSLTLRENINNTILENITNSKFATKTSGKIKQEIIIDCSPIYNNLINLYSKNPSWGEPPTGEEFAKSCTAKNIEQIADIELNVTSENIQEFGSNVEINIKKNFDQMEESIKDKNWVEASSFNKNINESQNIKRIIENVKKSNIKNIIVETLTNADIYQTLNVNMGITENIKQQAKVTLLVTSISDFIFKDIDKTFLDTKITQLEKKEEKDQVTNAFSNIFNNIISSATYSFIIFIAIAGLLLYIIGPCNMPYLSKFCTKEATENTKQILDNRSQYNMKNLELQFANPMIPINQFSYPIIPINKIS
jgi:hypothetical protein